MNPRMCLLPWDRLDCLELKVVRRFTALAQFRSVRLVTEIVNLMADGWMYPPIALGIYGIAGHRGGYIIARAALAVLVGHVIHVALKRGLSRLRPFDRDPSLEPIARVLDRYSFPSGHCMTLVCVAVPIVTAAPRVWPIFGLYIVLLAACRLVAALHYPSDVLAGIALGLTVAWPISAITFGA